MKGKRPVVLGGGPLVLIPIVYTLLFATGDLRTGTAASNEDVYGYVYYWNGKSWSKAVGAEVWVEKNGLQCAGPETSNGNGWYFVDVCPCSQSWPATLTVLAEFQGVWGCAYTVNHPGGQLRLDLYMEHDIQRIPRQGE
ncbi:MAG: hypothetical protein H5U03_02810 [Clostridia bacterium]|nr:hypothetical protein [Calditrichota bacterium]MBC7344353.1 hypothetical protein [Clostridia bacterium]